MQGYDVVSSDDHKVGKVVGREGNYLVTPTAEEERLAARSSMDRERREAENPPRAGIRPGS